eukprot:2103145-Rhodomonas_salina.2
MLLGRGARSDPKQRCRWYYSPYAPTALSSTERVPQLSKPSTYLLATNFPAFPLLIYPLSPASQSPVLIYPDLRRENGPVGPSSPVREPPRPRREANGRTRERASHVDRAGHTLQSQLQEAAKCHMQETAFL